MATKLYRFRWDCGRQGEMLGIFAADERKVKAAIGKTVNFGEVLGKHSEVEGTLEASEFTVLTDDMAFIRKATQYGLIPMGHNPLDILAEDAREKRRAAKWEREHASD